MKLTAAEVCRKYNTSLQTLQHWRVKGLQYEKKTPTRFLYDEEVLDKFYKEVVQSTRRILSNEDEDITDIKKRLERSKAENLELKNQILQDKYIKIDDAKKILVSRAAKYRDALEKIKQKVVILTNGDKEIEKEIDKIIMDVVEGLIWNGPKKK